jgi:hypothetical protein
LVWTPSSPQYCQISPISSSAAVIDLSEDYDNTAAHQSTSTTDPAGNFVLPPPLYPVEFRPLSLSGLAGFQRTDGSFLPSEALYAFVSEWDARRALHRVLNNFGIISLNEAVESAWATLLALALLETRLGDERGAWMLMEDKARSWLDEERYGNTSKLKLAMPTVDVNRLVRSMEEEIRKGV